LSVNSIVVLSEKDRLSHCRCKFGYNGSPYKKPSFIRLISGSKLMFHVNLGNFTAVKKIGDFLLKKPVGLNGFL